MMKLGVVIMVKNESKVIERCLTSILRLEPDLVIITDTGSTDDTIIKAGLFLQEHNLKFKIYQETFKNFAHNRTLLLEYSRKEDDLDYVVMVDADDMIAYRDDYTKDAFRASLTAQIYYLRYQDGTISYTLPKLTSNKIPLKYKGVTHEFLDCENFSQDASGFIWTLQRNDGFRRVSNNKNSNDIELLQTALEDEPDEFLRIRYLFYLAQAYHAAGDKLAAIDAYKRRAEAGGWNEEVFYSHYQIGNLYQEMGETYHENVIFHY